MRAAKQRVGCDHAGNPFALHITRYTAIHSPYMRPRIGCGHAGAGAVAAPSMSYESAAVLCRDPFVCMNRTCMSIKTI